MDRFIRVNGKDFSFEEVAKALGFEVAPHLEPVQIHLCQKVNDGVLVAKGAFFDNDDYPSIDLELELPAEKDSLPVAISKTEQPRVEGAYSDGFKGIRNFVYNRLDEYFMYSDVDSRADEVVDRDGMEATRVMLSGSPQYDVEVYQENHYVHFKGEQPFVQKTIELFKKLEVGMVGRLKDEEGIKKTLRGRPFVVVAVGDDGFASCKISIGGKDQTFMVHVSQMEQVEMPSPALGDFFGTKMVDGHVLAGLDRMELTKALEDAPIGTVITGVRDAPGSYGYGKYDFDTHIEKHGGHVQNYFAPVKTTNYETWWTVDGAKKDVYGLADILQGKSKYYALTEKIEEISINDKGNSASELARRLVEFAKDYDCYHFQDTLRLGGEEEAGLETEQQLSSKVGVLSFVDVLTEIVLEGELTDVQETKARLLIDDLTSFAKNLVSESLESKLQNAKDMSGRNPRHEVKENDLEMDF